MLEKTTAIEYSAAAQQGGIQGRLILKVHVNADGSIGDIDVAAAVDPSLDGPAIAAVRTWRFQPATRCGKPVAAVYTVARTFELGD